MKPGRVKHYNLWKGFGFIEAEDGGPDIYAHITSLDGFPERFPHLMEGEAVLYDAEPGEPDADGGERLRALVVSPGPDRICGTVTEYGFQEGYGSIEGEDGNAYFLHHSNILGGGYKSAEPGDRVSFRPAEDGTKGAGHKAIALQVKLGDPRPQLHRFGQFPAEVTDWLDPLADLADDEDWEFHHELAGRGGPRPVLREYVEKTFVRLLEERRRGRLTIVETDCEKPIAVFNSGLVTEDQEAIFALFEPNRRDNATSLWWWRAFVRESDRRLSEVAELPEPADYLDDIDQLFLRPDDVRKMQVDVQHVVKDHLGLFPEQLRSDPKMARLVLQGDIENLPDRLRRNYKAGVPQLYRGQPQMLLPLDLGGEGTRQDAALVVEKMGSGYRASTMLGVDLAYCQSRLIARPDPEWLGEAWLKYRSGEQPVAEDA